MEHPGHRRHAILRGARTADPSTGGAGFAAGYQALTPYFDEMFLGRTPVGQALTGQRAANAAADN